LNKSAVYWTKPRLTQEEIDESRLKAKIAKLVNKHNHLIENEVNCPNCGEHFVPDCEGEVEAIEAELTQLGALKALKEKVENARYSEASLIAEEMRQPNVARSAEVEARVT
jgi:hypothetical protein